MSEVPFTIIGVSTDAVWKMKPMMILKQINEMLKIEFPICSFGAQASLQIVLWTTSEPVRSKFADLECTHGTHASPNPPPRLPDAASAALAQAVALTAATDVAPAFTTKIDGMHPIFATRYDKAAAGLHRRSVQADEPALNAFLSTAADLADMPLCLFCQDDVPSDLKIKTLDTGALDKFKARFCVVGTTLRASPRARAAPPSKWWSSSRLSKDGSTSTSTSTAPTSTPTSTRMSTSIKRPASTQSSDRTANACA